MIIGKRSSLVRAKSILVTRVRKKPFISTLDIDSTLTGPKAHQVQMHELVNRFGAQALVTARHSLMVLSDKARLASQKYGFGDIPPKLGLDPVTGRHHFTPPELLPEFAGHLNPAAVYSFGVGVQWQQEDMGFAPDLDYDALFDPNFRPNTWKHIEMNAGEGDLYAALSPLEDETAFWEGRTNVPPLPYRFQFNPKNYGEKTDLKLRLAGYLSFVGQARNYEFVDESKPDEGHYTFYLVPKFGTKKIGVEFIVSSALEAANVPPNELRIMCADDALTGLPMLDMLSDVQLKGFDFALPGGAPIAKHFMPASSQYGKDFAGEPVAPYLRRLQETPVAGVYHWLMPNGIKPRTFIIGDEAATGHVAAGSLLALQARGLIYRNPA